MTKPLKGATEWDPQIHLSPFAFAGERHQMGQYVVTVTMKFNSVLTDFHGNIES